MGGEPMKSTAFVILGIIVVNVIQLGVGPALEESGHGEEDTPGWKDYHSNTYQYNEGGSLEATIDEHWTGLPWARQEMHEYTYDDSSRLVKDTRSTGYHDEWFPSEEVIHT
jgi:hypothetical protein